MRLGTLLWLVAVGCAACSPGESGDSSSTVFVASQQADPLLEIIAREGRVRVVAEFNLGNEALQTRADVIARATREVVRASKGHFTIARQFKVAPIVAGWTSAEGLRILRAHPRVRRVDLDASGRGQMAEALPMVGLNQVHSDGFTGSGVTVAVLDTGFRADHPDLAGDLDDEACFCTGCCPAGGDTQLGVGSAADDHGHGTHVSGIITSTGSSAPLGGAPDAKIVAVKVMDQNNNFCCISDVIAGLEWVLVEHPEVDLINASLGTGALFPSTCDSATAWMAGLTSVIGELRNSGVLVMASAGNQGSVSETTAPACIDAAISVGAVWDSNLGQISSPFCLEADAVIDGLTCFSNTSDSVDIVAPGAPMLSTGLSGPVQTFYGTSQASPLVVACAATLLQAKPDLGADELEAILEASPVTVNDDESGLSYPRLDCVAALAMIDDPDADGIDEGDNCPAVANPEQLDTDGDALGDACDVCSEDADNDSDGDGVCGDIDNCPLVSNANQYDGDSDEQGDPCDPCPADAQNDDPDEDGLCGASDPCPTDALNDDDSDGVCGAIDNCPLVSNAGQEDEDQDGSGDLCDVCPQDPQAQAPGSECASKGGCSSGGSSSGAALLLLLLMTTWRCRLGRQP